MLHLIPSPLHRAALKLAHRLRHHWRKVRRTTPDGVSVIAHDLEGQILLVRHSYGPDGWYFPGGGIARGEAPEDFRVAALARGGVGVHAFDVGLGESAP